MTSLYRLRFILSLALFFLLVACSDQVSAPPEYDSPTPNAELQSAEDIARIAISPSSLILEPGATTTLEVTYQNDAGETLGPADPNEATLKVSGAGFSATWVGPGQVTVSSPTTITTGYVSASLTNDPQVFGVSSASVVDLQPSVIDLPDSTIIFPRTDYDFGNQTGDQIAAYLFEPFTEAEFEQTVSSDPSQAPLFPVVLEGAESLNLQAGDLIVGSGGGFLYGRIEKVVAERHGRTLLAVRAVLPDEVFSSFDQSFDYDALEADGVVPETLELDLLPPPTEGELSTQFFDGGCSASFFDITASVDLDLSLSAVTLENDLSISGIGEVSGSCDLSYTWPMPIGGVYSFLIMPAGFVEGTVGLDVAANQGEFEPQTYIGVSSKTQLLPTLELLESPQPEMRFDPLPQFGDWADVNGGDGYVRFTGDASINGGVKFLVLGVMGQTLKLFNGKVVKTKYADIIKTLNKVATGASVDIFATANPVLTGQWATMRSALNDASSKAFDKLTLSGRAAVTEGWIMEVLGRIWVDLDVGAGFEVEVRNEEHTPAELSVSVTSDDGEGSAAISVTNNTPARPLSKVQLGNNPVNSLHGDTTPVTGGNVTYDPAECDALGSVKAKTLAIAQLPVFSIGAPFNSHEVVEIECLGPPSIRIDDYAPTYAEINWLGNKEGTVTFTNSGQGTLKYTLHTSDSTRLSLSSSSGMLKPGETTTVSFQLSCESLPDNLMASPTLLRKYEPVLTIEHNIPNTSPIQLPGKRGLRGFHCKSAGVWLTNYYTCQTISSSSLPPPNNIAVTHYASSYLRIRLDGYRSSCQPDYKEAKGKLLKHVKNMDERFDNQGTLKSYFWRDGFAGLEGIYSVLFEVNP